MMPKKVMLERDRGVYVYSNEEKKMIVLHLWELLLTYRDNDDLSVLRAADRNINNSFVDSLSK